MDKKVIKTMIIILSIFGYLMNLVFIFFCKPFDILMSNIILWLMCFLIMICFKFVEWLNDW